MKFYIAIIGDLVDADAGVLEVRAAVVICLPRRKDRHRPSVRRPEVFVGKQLVLPDMADEALGNVGGRAQWTMVNGLDCTPCMRQLR